MKYIDRIKVEGFQTIEQFWETRPVDKQAHLQYNSRHE